MKKIMIVFGLLLAHAGSYCQNPTDSLTRELEALSQKNLLEGFGVAICSKDQVFYQKGFGYADRENHVSYTAHTVQKIASISKTFLGFALMKAQEMKLLDMDDAASDYLPFPLIHPYYPKTKISIRHLATHTAGLKSSKFDREALFFPTPIPSIGKEISPGIKKLLFKRLAKSLNNNSKSSLADFLYKIYHEDGAWYKKSNFSKVLPGRKRMYSNNGAAFLALILEKASNMKYADFVRKYILEPLEMQHTQFDFEVKNRSGQVKSSLYHAGIEIPKDYQLISYPAGGIETSLADFNKFMRAMMEGYFEGNELLSQDLFQEMMRPQIKPEFRQGILWEVHARSIGHTGDLAGVTTHAYFSKETGLAFILFSNTTATKNLYKETGAILEVMQKYSLDFTR